MDSYKVTGSTDIDGLVELQGETVWYQTSVSAEPEGYYKSMKYGHWTIKRAGNRWEPWPVEVDLMLKKIRNPKPMYVAKFDAQKWIKFPEKKLGPFGFDLMVGDWVDPLGAGIVPDFIIQGEKDDPSDSSPHPKGRILLSFSNPNDGVVKVADQGGSKLVGPSLAPEFGYSNKWDFVNWTTHSTTGDMIRWDFSDEVYIFRVRTKVDNTGAIIAANYGKIDGRIVGKLSKTAPRIMMTYYLNQTPNDVGLEWDMKNNLIKDTSGMRIPERP
jgi:hypothetical protein